MPLSQVTGKKAIVVPIYKRGDRSVVTNYRPISLTSVVCKQMEHVIAGYLRQVWVKYDWLHDEQHCFRPGYSCESQVITVCLDISDSLDEGVGIDAIVIDFSKVPHDRLLMKLAASGVDMRIVIWVREFLVGRTQRRRSNLKGSQINIRCTARERFGPTFVPGIRKLYLEEH
jgi:hypothetical protein